MTQPTYNEHKFINQVVDLLREEGIEPEVVSYADISLGASKMLRGMGVRTVLDMTDTIDRTWPSKQEETESPW
ncbi:hypothetical protein [Glycomyces salinus]|uniref:hypothetical protein n=1 Tax=Glycomyces salinus TaxID=980294 RepID=UPI0018ECBAB3|nr:hypothetical protein [Glycomyces salinus]